MAEKETRDKSFNIYVSIAEMAALQKAAQDDGLKLATWSRRVLMKAIAK